jgi:DNA (cytosine-5)-methyltransferase 1
VRKWLSTVPRPWAVDIFCGAGGLSLGLKDAGINVVAAADHDPAAVETHRSNLGNLSFEGDLSDASSFLDQLAKWNIKKVDVVTGGPPCQPFSRAGSSKIRDLVRAGVRESMDPRTKLWWTFVDVIDALEPRVVLFENVPDLASWDDGTLLVELLSSLRERGYQTDARILEAFKYGVPQHRTRLFVVGTRGGGHFSWPDPLKKSVTLKDAIGDLPRVGAAHRKLSIKYEKPKSPLQKRLRRDVPKAEQNIVTDHVTRDVREDDAEAFSLLKPGQTYKDLPERLQRYRSDIFDDKYKRLKWGEVSRTITAHIAKDGYWYIHPSQNRTLSIREAARIQTFPDWFRFAGHPSFQYKQIGNAVPPLLAEAVGKSIVAFLSTSPQRSIPHGTFRTALLRWHRGHTTSCPWKQRTATPWDVLLGELVLAKVDPEDRAGLFKEIKKLAPSPTQATVRWRELRRWGKANGFENGINRILQVAREIVRKHNGRVPEEDLALRSLPAVGDRTASAVRTFGQLRTAVVLDAGARRLVQRITGRPSLHAWQHRLEILKLAGHLGPDADFAEAVGDFTHLVCTTGEPACTDCPVKDLCATATAKCLSKSA